MLSLSEKQEAMLAFIEKFVAQNGYPPTHEEIKKGLKISTKAPMNHHLEAAEQADLLVCVPNTPQGARLRAEDAGMGRSSHPAETSLPPLDADEIVELTSNILTQQANLYAMKVQEVSLDDSFVSRGDIVILQQQSWVHNGEMAAICLLKERQITFRRFYRENGHVRLEPAQNKLKPIVLPPEAVEIQGKVLAIIRQGESVALPAYYAAC